MVKDRAENPSSPDLAVESNTNYKTDGNDFTDQQIAAPVGSGATNFRIEYSVVEGSGRLYVQRQRGNAPVRKSSAVRTLSTSNAASVMLDMNGTTNKIRATAAGAAPTTAIFIFGYPNVAITGGNEQEGVFGGQLDDPLVVKVTDGRGRAISGLAAVFSSAHTGRAFIPVPGTTVFTTNALGNTLAPARSEFTRVATSTLPAPGDGIVVETDSRGEARTYFQLGTSTSDPSQTVDVEAGGSMTP